MTSHLDSLTRKRQLGFGLTDEAARATSPDPTKPRLACQSELPDHVYARHLIAAAPAHVREHFDLELRDSARRLAHSVDLDEDDLDELDDLDDRAPRSVTTETFVDLAESRGGDRIDVRTGGRVPIRLARAREVVARLAPKVLVPVAAITLLVIAMGGTWSTASATPAAPWSATRPPSPPSQPSSAHPSTAAAALSPGPSGLDEPPMPRTKISRKDLIGKLNLNTASEDQLMMLPTVGPSKAERIVTWRKKNGGFKRTADLRRVKGFGYKTFKKLEPFLDVKGDTTLSSK